MNAPLRVAADIGGTFTDIAVFLPDGRLVTRKVPSTPDDYGRGVIQGIQALAGELPAGFESIGSVLHGCTIATNAILEKKGACTALLTTRGFRDVLELRRIRVPRLYEPLYVKPEPLAPRNLRFEVTERLAADGSVLVSMDETDVLAAIDAIRAADVEAVAVCFLHSYLNPKHERRAGEMLRSALPGVFVTISADVLPEIREYERTSTTVINAYVGRPVSDYIGKLASGLRAAGFAGDLLVMQSSGGILDAASVLESPARIVECGPAAGVIGAAQKGLEAGYRNLITFDMGGTTAKASLVEGGRISRTDEYEVGGGVSLSSRLVKGGGYALKLPVIDISEVGAGGGSIIRIDKAGALKVGPDSAGAVPGPVCYGLGGTRATVTDASVALGFVNPVSLAGGSVPIDAEMSRTVLREQVADPLGIPLEEAAWWVHIVASSSMMRAVKAVSTYRGRNPCDFVLMAFGGNGGIFAVELARQLQIARVIVPAAAGVFSAIGLCVAHVEFNQTRAFLRRLSTLDPAELQAAFVALESEVAAKLGPRSSVAQPRRSAAMRYAGQAFELPIPAPAGAIDVDGLRKLGLAFGAEHARTYGHRLDGFDVEIVAIDVVLGASEESRPAATPGAIVAAGAPPGSRRAYFGRGLGWLDTEVLMRSHLGERPRRGPFIVEEYEGTTLVPPGAEAWLDPHGNIVIATEVDPTPADIAMAGQTTAPFLLEVVKNALDTIADELAIVVMRTACSSIVRDAIDYSTAICDAEGRTLAQGVTTPLHLGSFFDAMQNLIAKQGSAIYEGDVFIFNDPYLAAGQHLPDIYIVRPIFIHGVLEGWATTVAHHNDVGGIVPGSNSIGSTEIYQEGLRLPLLKLFDAGCEAMMIWDIIAANVRVPDKVIGDLKAQIAACLIGEREFKALFARYGAPVLRQCFADIHDYAERLTRAEFRAIPDGTYRFENHIDGIGERPEPIVFRVALTVQGDEVTIDWTGTSPQVPAGINAPVPFTKAAAYAALRSVLGAEIPNAQGFTRPIRVIAPSGTIVNPVTPAACGARGITGFRMIDCLMGALAQAVPDRVPADGSGGSTIPSIGGWHGGHPWVFVETIMGTSGGSAGLDGQEGVAHVGANQSNIPIEMIEAEHPLRVESYGFVRDTGGVGKHRGGLAIQREFRLLGTSAVLNVRSDKRRFPPYGLDGGGSGSSSMNVINPGCEDERVLPVLTADPVTLKQADRFRHVMASGGGYGHALERDPSLVLQDVVLDKVSAGQAREVYGVVVVAERGSWHLDVGATRTLRTEMGIAACPAHVF